MPALFAMSAVKCALVRVVSRDRTLTFNVFLIASATAEVEVAVGARMPDFLAVRTSRYVRFSKLLPPYFLVEYVFGGGEQLGVAVR